MAYYTYILASKKDGVFYVGVTSDLIGRIYQHKRGMADGFTKKYHVKLLVYYEIHDEVEQAIRREKSIKRWTRAKKITAIKEMNSAWADLYSSLF
ncbi:MAG: GIY-YIG nuclease family protein [Rickettsiales bacterium]